MTDRFDWRNNIGIIGGAISVAFVALRLLAISNFDPATAVAVLQYSGTTSVILGTILSVWPELLLLALLLSLAGLFLAGSEDTPGPAFRHGVLFISLLAIVALSAPRLVTAVDVAGAIALIVAVFVDFVLQRPSRLRRLALRADPARTFRDADSDDRTVLSAARSALLFIGIFYFALQTMSTTVWLSSESITLSNLGKPGTNGPYTVYVLKEDDNALYVLDEDAREVTRILRFQVASRRKCYIPETNPLTRYLAPSRAKHVKCSE